MITHVLQAAVVGALLMSSALPLTARAQEAAFVVPSVVDNTATPPLSLRTTTFERQPMQSSRYSLRARFQREESAGELREGGDFVLFGRFAKAGISCDANTVFRNGFEN